MAQRENQHPTAEGRAWLVWGSAALFFFYQFILRVSPSVMTDELMSTFAIDACALGTVVAFYYNAYFLFQIPAGALLDRFGPRRMLSLAALLCILGCIFFATATSPSGIALGRFLTGAGSAFGFLSCLKIGTTWFSPQQLPFVIGVTLFLGTSGAVGGGAPLSVMVGAIGWKATLWWLASFGGGVLILIFLLVRDRPSKKEETSLTPLPFCETLKVIIKSLLVILKKPQTWILALYGSLMYIPLSAFADMWGVKFLVEVYKTDKNVAAAAISAFYIGMGASAPLFPFLCRYLKSYKFSLSISAFGSTVLFIALLVFTAMPLWLLSGILFLLGGFSGGQVLAFSVACDINAKEVSATASGFHNMACMMSGVIFQPLIGHFLLLYGENPGPSGYIGALSSIPLVTFMAFFVVFFIREAYAKEEGQADLALEKL